MRSADFVSKTRPAVKKTDLEKRKDANTRSWKCKAAAVLKKLAACKAALVESGKSNIL